MTSTNSWSPSTLSSTMLKHSANRMEIRCLQNTKEEAVLDGGERGGEESIEEERDDDRYIDYYYKIRQEE